MIGHLIACGQQLPIDAVVIPWTDDNGFSAYLKGQRYGTDILPAKPAAGCNVPTRYGQRPYCPRKGGTLDQLREGLWYVTFHHSVTMTAKDCFYILHDRRGLSVHLIVETNGVIYQTLDLREKDRGAKGANLRSVNVEVVSMADAVAYPHVYPDGDREIVIGEIHGKQRECWSYTPQQIASCKAIAATLCREFPGMAPLAPWFINRKLDQPHGRSFGIRGHWHVDQQKWDPNPAFPFLQVQRAAQRAVWESIDLFTALGRQRALQCAGQPLPRFSSDGQWGKESERALQKVRAAAGLGEGGWDDAVEDYIRHLMAG